MTPLSLNILFYNSEFKNLFINFKTFLDYLNSWLAFTTFSFWSRSSLNPFVLTYCFKGPIDGSSIYPLIFLLMTCISVRSAWWKDEMSLIFYNSLQLVASIDWVSQSWLRLLWYCLFSSASLRNLWDCLCGHCWEIDTTWIKISKQIFVYFSSIGAVWVWLHILLSVFIHILVKN